MGWLDKIKGFLPISINVSSSRQTIVQINKVNVFELETCQAKGIVRERSFWRTEKIDIFHKKEDGSVTHTPAD